MSAAPEEMALSAAQDEKKAAAVSTVLASLLITAGKLTVGLWTGSLGILAEAADSALDVVAGFLTFAAVRVSGKPADESHPYGHGKVENMAALAETLLLLFTCGWIIFEAISRLFFKSVEIDANVWAFGVVIISMMIDLNRMRALQRAADKHDSQALQASALRFRTDLWTSSVVLLGLTLVRLQEWIGGPAFLLKADAVAGLGVAAVVLFLGVRLGKSAVDVLLDTAPKGLGEQINRRVVDIDGVQGCRQVRVRRSGAQCFVDLVLEIDGDATFDGAHEITAQVERLVDAMIPRADVIVHYEPTEDSYDVASLVTRLAQSVGAQAHNVWVRESEGRFHVELDLEVDRSSSLQEAHEVATRLERHVKEAAPGVAQLVAHLEPAGDGNSTSTLLAEDRRANLEARIVSDVDTLMGEGRCHHVTIWEEDGGLAASLHCLLAPELSVEEAHNLSEQLESHLCERIPQLRRVVVHLEPAPGR